MARVAKLVSTVALAFASTVMAAPASAPQGPTVDLKKLDTTDCRHAVSVFITTRDSFLRHGRPSDQLEGLVNVSAEVGVNCGATPLQILDFRYRRILKLREEEFKAKP